ncbi:MAG: phosphate ABC transporter substrate-binding protein [Lachnospiraceae bacterium]|nr:phosphate ABC transporter substrate-binding protein [Lachnospiraceae bacterium]
MKKTAGIGSGILIGFILWIMIYSTGGGRDIFPMQKEKEPDTEDMSAEGVIVMAGSTAMENLSGVLAEGFMAAYPNIVVTVEFTGSSAGIESVLAGRADIGNSSRRLRQEELNAGAVEHVAAIDGIAVITHPSNAVEGLTMRQLRDIYAGRIRNWQEAGGADEAIVVVGREAGSGTRSVFEEILDMQDICTYANEMDSSGAVMARVAATPGAIGYVSIDIPDDTVRTLALDGRLPTREEIQGGGYRLSRPLIMVTDGAVSQQSAAVREFISYIHSEEGRQLIESVGLAVPPYDIGDEVLYLHDCGLECSDLP